LTPFFRWLFGPLYSLSLAAVLLLGAPWWLFRMATSGRYRAGLAGRLGRIPASLRAWAIQNHPNGRPTLWIHAVSVGEVLVATRIVEELTRVLPSARIAVSTTTATGQALAHQRLPHCAVFYLPLDLRYAVRRYLNTIQPDLLVLVESELWPNLIAECRARRIPIAVANARISDRSFPRYLRLRRLWQPVLAQIDLFLAQSTETASRLHQIGGPALDHRVQTTGNIKYDARANDENAMTRRIGSLLFKTRLIAVGSTLSGEEQTILDAWPAIRAAAPDTALLIAPRHPDRFEDVLALIRQSGYPFFRCSHLLLDTEPIFGGTILLLDTIGDLASIFSIADLAFIGGSLVPRGGHNPLEPAQFAVPVLMGPSYENFREIVETMREADGIRIVQNKAALEQSILELLTDRPTAHAIGARGQSVFAAQSGATARTVAALLTLLPQPKNTSREGKR
jgi:3-deoxy-D-manno-octulosonic-acid transferase